MQPGERLGPYEIVSPLGAGGMGEVYRARDSRLGREVAVKVLGEGLSGSEELRQRFEREARAISALSHPHICSLYDVGRDGDTDFLVMELVVGQTLAERVARGPLPVAEAMELGAQIADALAAAHRQGVVHRDLKPGNVMLSRAGAKLLDFGLAKLTTGKEQDLLATGFAGMATATALPLTARGTLLGTLQYMAPEQLEGGEADHRSDLFALGAMLYEMLTGRRAFPGSSPASVIAAVIGGEPPPLAEAQPLSPPGLDRLVRRCLAKDPDARWQSAADVADELRWLAGEPAAGAAVEPARTRSRLWPALAAAAVAAAALALLVAWASWPSSVTPAATFVVLPPEGVEFAPFQGAMAVSPDGRGLAFVADRNDTSQIWLRRIDSLQATALPGTDGAYLPFWSADGRSIGFFARGSLYRIEIAGGPAQALAPAPDARGGSWARDGTIVFAPTATGGLQRVAAAGGQVTPVTTLDEEAGHRGHWSPSFLPDDRRFIFLAEGAGDEELQLADLDGGAPVTLRKSQTGAAYAEPGYLLFSHERALLAQRFDRRRGTLAGSPFLVAEKVEVLPDVAHATFAVSASGLLAYYPLQEDGETSVVVSVDAEGSSVRRFDGLGDGSNLDLSPDGRRLAMQRRDRQTGNMDIWVLDLVRGTTSRVTSGAGDERGPVWAPDGLHLAYVAHGDGGWRLERRLASGTGEAEVLLETERWLEVVDWSSDSGALLLETWNEATERDLEVLVLDGMTRHPYAADVEMQRSGRFSTDGRWIAYESHDTGRTEIYVQPFPATGARWQVSTEGGTSPRWDADGRELTYVNAESLWRVAVGEGDEPTFGLPEALFAAPSADYEPLPDGQGFLLREPAGQSTAPPMHVMLDWRTRLPPD